MGTEDSSSISETWRRTQTRLTTTNSPSHSFLVMASIIVRLALVCLAICFILSSAEAARVPQLDGSRDPQCSYRECFESDALCRDLHEKCPGWDSFCEDPAWARGMAQECPVTCKTCTPRW